MEKREIAKMSGPLAEEFRCGFTKKKFIVADVRAWDQGTFSAASRSHF